MHLGKESELNAVLSLALYLGYLPPDQKQQVSKVVHLSFLESNLQLPVVSTPVDTNLLPVTIAVGLLQSTAVSTINRYLGLNT